MEDLIIVCHRIAASQSVQVVISTNNNLVSLGMTGFEMYFTSICGCNCAKLWEVIPFLWSTNVGVPCCSKEAPPTLLRCGVMF